MPTILSTTFSVLVRGFLALTTPAPVAAFGLATFVSRGLEVLALAFVVVEEGVRAAMRRGLEFPALRG